MYTFPERPVMNWLFRIFVIGLALWPAIFLSDILISNHSRIYAAPVQHMSLSVPTHSNPSIPTAFDCTGPVRIMPLGNSITRGSGSPFFTGYRQPLYTNLRGAGYDVDFVGSQRNGGGTVLPFDLANEGHSGEAADWIADRVVTFLNENPADVVLLHIGTNDLLDGDTPADAVDDTERILNRIDDWEDDNNEVIVMLARIINRPTLHQPTSEYNNMLANMALARITDGDQIALVDMENSAGLEYQPNGIDWSDTIHPTYNGYQKMATLWHDRIRDELDLPECMPLQVNMTANQTLVGTGGNVRLTVIVTNRSDASMTNLVAADSPARTCNRSIGALGPGESMTYECSVNNFTADTILFVNLAGEMAEAEEVENTSMVHVAVQPQNNAPVIDLNGPVTAGSNRTVRFTEDKAPVAVVHPDAFVTDPNEDAQLDGAILTIANPLDGELERLAADVSGTAIAATYRAGAATLELSNRDTIANYQKVLRTVTYENSSQDPRTATRTIEISATDVSVAARNVSATGVSISAVNDAPTVGGTLRLEVLRRNERRVTSTILQATDVDNTSDELTFTVLTSPQHGTLRLGSSALLAGDIFTQSDIDRSRISYEHSTADGHANAAEDTVVFSVADGAGGLPAEASLAIDIVDRADTFLPFTPRN